MADHTCNTNGTVVNGAVREVKPGVFVVSVITHCSVCGVPTLTTERTQ